MPNFSLQFLKLLYFVEISFCNFNFDQKTSYLPIICNLCHNLSIIVFSISIRYNRLSKKIVTFFSLVFVFSLLLNNKSSLFAHHRERAERKKFTRSGVRTHAGMPPLELKSNALTTRPSWLRAGQSSF